MVENPYVQSLSAGRIPYEYYVYKQVYDINGKPLEGVFADINGDGKITADDKYLTGKSPLQILLLGGILFYKWGNLI